MLAPWKKSYDKSRQCIIKQRHYFANKGPSNKSYGFSSSHMRLWESDSKEGWAPKKWCFWTVVLEKTLENPLDCKEFKSINSSMFSHLYGPTLIYICDFWKNHSFDYTDLISKVMSLFFNALSRFFIVFLPKSMCLLISWLQSLLTVILEPKKIKSVTIYIFFPTYLPYDGTGCHGLCFLNFEF